LEREDRRDRADAVLAGSVRALVDVHLHDLDPIAILGRELGDDRRDLPARSAPLRPEIDDGRLVGLEDLGFEVLIGHFLDIRHESLPRPRCRALFVGVGRSVWNPSDTLRCRTSPLVTHASATPERVERFAIWRRRTGGTTGSRASARPSRRALPPSARPP